MERKQCEELILQKLKEINEIYKEYHPAGYYLTLSIFNEKDEPTYMFNNSYYNEDDENRPINFYKNFNEKGE